MPGPTAYPILSTLAVIAVVVVIAALAALVARSTDAPSWPVLPPQAKPTGRHRPTAVATPYIPRSWDSLPAPISAPPVATPEPEPVALCPLDEGWDWRAFADDRELVAA